MTVSAWLPTWQASRVHLRASTRAVTDSLVRNHVLPAFGERQLASVTPTDVQAFIAHLEEKGLAPSTIRQCYLVVAGVFSSAFESDIIARTPCRGINLPKAAHTEMRFLTPDQVEDLASAIDDRYRALVITAAYTGCRFGEMAGIRIDRIDLLRRTLTVVETLSDVNGRVRLTPPKTTAARRQIALPRYAVRALEEHLGRWSLGEEGFVFSSPTGGPLRRTNFRRRVWIPAVRASVGEPLRFHDLRHTHAALLIAQGEHPKVIQTRLGHSSIQVTLDTYGHLFDGLDEAAADRLDEIIPRTPADSSRTRGLQTPRQIAR
jgi:integrase